MTDPLESSMQDFVAKTVNPSVSGRLQKLPLSVLRKSPYQPRLRNLKKSDLTDLMNSIQAAGLTNPIVVAPNPDEKGTYYVHQGERRWLSVQHLGWNEIDVIVKIDLSPTVARKLAIADNMGREHLTAFEQAKALIDYQEVSGLGFEEAAQDLGVSRATAFRLKNIAGCSEPMQEVLKDSMISVVAGSLLAKLESQDGKKALRLAQAYRDGKVAVLDIEHALEVDRTQGGRPRAAKKDVEVTASERGVELRASWSHTRSGEESKIRIVQALGEFLRRLNVSTEDAVRLWKDADGCANA